MIEEMGTVLTDTENTLVISLLVRQQLIAEELQKEQNKINDALGKVITDVRIRADLPEGQYQLVQQEVGSYRLVEVPLEPGTEYLGDTPKDV